jgi:pimeloyl-ACP methyl ester carboxylesterase
VLPTLERHHDVLAPTLPGHAGGAPIGDRVTIDVLADAVERAMEAAGFETAHFAGNSLGGYLALRLAMRGRAESVVAFAPAGGWVGDDASRAETLERQKRIHEELRAGVANIDLALATAASRRRATQLIAENFEHIPRELIAHQLAGAAACPAAIPMLDYALRADWNLDAQRVTCPVRIVWGTADRLLPWPSAAARYRKDWLPRADWVVLDGVGHSPQLDVPLEAAHLILGLTEA